MRQDCIHLMIGLQQILDRIVIICAVRDCLVEYSGVTGDTANALRNQGF